MPPRRVVSIKLLPSVKIAENGLLALTSTQSCEWRAKRPFLNGVVAFQGKAVGTRSSGTLSASCCFVQYVIEIWLQGCSKTSVLPYVVMLLRRYYRREKSKIRFRQW